MLNNKKIPILCDINFESVFTGINNIKRKENRPKINITYTGEKFY